MIKATKQAEKISVLLHSSSCHVFFNDESPRAAQSADYLVRFQNKHKKCCKGIIESDSMKYNQEKIAAGEKECYSYVHPKYPFIRSNRNPQMVEALLQSHIFPNRMTLEEEMYIHEKHKIHSRL